MVVQSVPGDAGVFLPAAENVAATASEPARDDSDLVIEEDALGGQMVRLHGRFSGVMRAEIIAGALRSDCVSAGGAGTDGTP